MRGISALLASTRLSAVLSFAAVLLATTAALVQPGFAVLAAHQLDLTENSDTSLSVTFDGSTTGIFVVEQVADQWLVSFPFDFSNLPQPPVAGWTEPDNDAQMNAVELFPNSVDALRVLSDIPVGGSPVGDGTPVSFGTDAGVAIEATFHDLGDTPVPEPASLALLGAGLFGVGWLQRRRTGRA